LKKAVVVSSDSQTSPDSLLDSLPDSLPDSTRIEVDSNVQVLAGKNGTTVLLGGSPYKLVTLRPAAAAVVAAFRAGSTILEASTAAGVSVGATEKLARRLLANGMAEHHDPPHQFSIDDITAVIPALNEAGAIAKVVHSLMGVGIRRVVVVDDGSSDATGEVARSVGAEVIKHPSSLGPGAARMSGLAQVETPLVLFVDADVDVDADADADADCDAELGDTWGSALIALLASFDDPAVAISAPRVRSLAEGSWIARYELRRSSLDLGGRRASVRPMSLISYVPSAVWLARVGVIYELGGFDSGLRFGEDVDLVWRAVKAGFTVRYEADVAVAHRPRHTIRALMKQRFQYGTSAAPLHQRHPGLVAPLAASGWSVLSWALAVGGGPIGFVAGAGTALATSAALEGKLSMLESPRRVAWKTAMRGHLGLGRQLASALWRAWLPIALVASLFSRRARWTVVAAGVLPGAEQWMKDRPPIDRIRFVGLRMLDDASYCSGVWQGCWKEKQFGALRPKIMNWPGRAGENNKATDQESTVD
jgi:mycofactocin glycosyltransferase